MATDNTKNENMKFWDKVALPPEDALKKIMGGRLKGKNDINPVWRIKVMTEHYGPVGTGWKYTIDKLWTEIGAGGEVCAFALISLYVDEMLGTAEDTIWSQPIPGIGGSMLVELEREGAHTSDECYKMAVTDALSVAMKALGVAADVYMGKVDGVGGDRTKYSDDGEKGKQAPDCPKCSKPGRVSKQDDAEKYYCWKKKGGCGHQWSDPEPEPEGEIIDFPELKELFKKCITIQEARVTWRHHAKSIDDLSQDEHTELKDMIDKKWPPPPEQQSMGDDVPW